MVSYTKTTPGAPTSGLYNFGDSVTDSLGIVWKCAQAGIPGAFVATPPYVEVGAVVARQGTLAAVTGLTFEEFGTGSFRHTRLTLASVAQVIPNGASEYVGTKLFTFPEGRIYVVGSIFTLTPTTTTDLTTTITSATSGAASFGSAIATNASLTSTMVDFAPSTAYTSSTVINVAAAAFSGVLASPAVFDGTGTAKDLYLNNSIAVNSADGTVTMSGTLDIVWVIIGDK